MIRGAVVLLAAALLTAGCSSDKPTKASGSTSLPMLVSGSVVLSGSITYSEHNPANSVCYTPGNSPLFPGHSTYDDVKQGAQVVVADAAGKTVGVGRLGPGATTRFGNANNPPPCRFGFDVENVPAASFYKVTVGHHSGHFTRGEMSRGPVLRLP